MKITRANVEQYAQERGFEPIQIDGIPDGFAWKTPDVTINDQTHLGKIIKFKPLADWADKAAITYE